VRIPDRNRVLLLTTVIQEDGILGFRLKPEFRLDAYHTIFFEVALIVVLCVFVTAFRFNFGSERVNEFPDFEETYEVYFSGAESIAIPRSAEISLPPPPRPIVDFEQPEDEIVEDLDLDLGLDNELILRSSVEIPVSLLLEDDYDEDIVFVAVQQLPELIGGLASLRNEIQYPEMARRRGIEGRVFVQFIVNEEGKVEDPKVIRGIGGGCDEEVYNAVKNMRFRPGMQRGRTVRVQFTISVLFRLYYY